MLERSDEARGWRGIALLLFAPALILLGLAAMWVVPAVVVSSTAVEPTPQAESWYSGDRTYPGEIEDPGEAPPVDLTAVDGDQPSPEPSMPVPSDGEEATQALPSDAATSADGSTKTLAQVMTGATVLRVGDSGLPVRFIQQRLNTAGIEVADNGEFDEDTAAGVDRLQEKFQLTQTGMVNRYTLDLLLRITERGPALPEQCNQGLVVCIDKTQRLIRVVADGQVTQVLDARFGALDAATEDGLFEVYDKRADDFSTDFGVPMLYSMYFAGGQAVHYSEYFARDGYSGASAGCVNTRDLDATRAMFDSVPRGSKVYIYR